MAQSFPLLNFAMTKDKDGLALLMRVLESYDQKDIAERLNKEFLGAWSREGLNRWLNGKAPNTKLSTAEYKFLEKLLPSPPDGPRDFRFIDLFAGIGGIRSGFEAIGGECVFTSEWNKQAIRTYKANWYCDPDRHVFREDIRSVTMSDRPDVPETEAYANIRSIIPDYDVLLAGFPCQPFSIAGVSKKNSLGRKHGFECDTQGTLFFDVARIIAATKPVAFLLENVKNLKSHDKGKTFRVIMDTLDELGYWVADSDFSGKNDPKIIDGRHFVPQHRERIVLVGFRKDLGVHEGFSLKDIVREYPPHRPSLQEILEPDAPAKYTLTPKLWEYLYNYSIKHKAKGNGFGYGLVNGDEVTRTLSARYHKDGSEILINHCGIDTALGLDHENNHGKRPRRLTPRECARLMGYDAPGQSAFNIPVSDTQAYKQFGNSVVVPVFHAVAKLMKDRVLAAKTRAAENKSEQEPLAA